MNVSSVSAVTLLHKLRGQHGGDVDETHLDKCVIFSLFYLPVCTFMTSHIKSKLGNPNVNTMVAGSCGPTSINECDY